MRSRERGPLALSGSLSDLLLAVALLLTFQICVARPAASTSKDALIAPDTTQGALFNSSSAQLPADWHSRRLLAPTWHPARFAHHETASADGEGRSAPGAPRAEHAQGERRFPVGKLFGWGIGGPRISRSGKDAGQYHVTGPSLPDLDVVAIAGSGHSMAVTAKGQVYSMGRNDSSGGGGHGSKPIPDAGQLGRGGSTKAALVDALVGIPIVQVATGRYHSAAVSADGRVFTWGLNDMGQLGRPALDKHHQDRQPCTWGPACRDGWPRQVDPAAAWGADPVVGITAGRYHTLLVTAAGKVWTFGANICDGEVPLEEFSRARQMAGGGLGGVRVTAVDAGYVAWIAAASDGSVWTCHSGFDGYAGTLEHKVVPGSEGEMGREGDPMVPGRVTEGGLGDLRVVAVATGRVHCLVATEAGEVYIWGKIPHGPPRSQLPVRLHGLGDSPIRHVGAGEYFSLAASDTEVFAFGVNGNGQLGVGKAIKDSAKPMKVAGALATGHRIFAVVAGYQHSLAIAAPAASGEPRIVTRPAPRSLLPQPMREAPAPAPAAAGAGGDKGFHVVWSAAHGPVPEAAGSTSPSAMLKPVWEAWEQHRWSPRHELIAHTSPDVFRLEGSLPTHLLKGPKSPCWKRNGSLKCLPFFHVLGVSKCSTTDIYRRLGMHPQVVRSNNKGPHFWDECPYPSTGPCTCGGQGMFPDYTSLYDPLAQAVEAGETRAISGDASSNTFTASHVYLRGHHPRSNVTIAELLHEAQPYLRLITIFRDPVDRLYSAFYYYPGGDTKTPEGFDAYARQCIKKWNDCVGGKGTPACIRGFEPQQLIKGMYAEFLEDWVEHWPREQLLFLTTEQYKEDMEGVLDRIMQFLDLDALNDKQRTKIMAAPRANAQKNQPMLPKTRKLLNEFYKPFNKRLSAMMNDPAFDWPKAR